MNNKHQGARGDCRIQQTNNDSSRAVPKSESSHHQKAATGSTGVLFIGFYCYYYIIQNFGFNAFIYLHIGIYVYVDVCMQ